MNKLDSGEETRTAAATGRNGNIELLRYAFAYVVAIEHFCLRAPGVVLPAVDFFFLAAGFFQMRRMTREKSFSPVRYLGERFGGMAFLYETSILLLLVFSEEGIGLKTFLSGLYRAIPDMLCLQMTGIFELHVNPPLWFFSAMLLAGAVLSLLFSYDRRLFFHTLPLLVLLSFACLFYCQGNMDAIYSPNFINPTRYLIPLGTIRALGGLGLGCLVWMAYERWGTVLQKPGLRAALSAAELFAVGIVLINALFRHHTAYDFYTLLFLPVLFVCALSQNTWWGGVSHRLGKGLSACMGKQFTLALYCLHMPVIRLEECLMERFPEVSPVGKTLLFIVLVTAISFLFAKASERLSSRRRKPA